MQSIFIVEDDENIRELVCYALKSADFEAFGFERGADFWGEVEKVKPSLILLDIMLPNEDGIEILKTLRSNILYKDTPVIMLTAKSSEYDKVKGLDFGADDYITKPFGVMELISRIKAVLRRTTSQSESKILKYKNISLDINKRIVLVGNETIALTYKEFELLTYLFQNKSIVLSRDKIMERVWGFNFEGESRTVDMHIKTLRQKLGDSGNLIETVRGVGYKLG